MWIEERALENWQTRGPGGQARYADAAINTTLMLRTAFRLALDALFAELDQLWRDFDGELRQGKLTHLDYDAQRKTLTWRKPKVDHHEAAQNDFYAKLPARSIADIFRFVNERCGFLSTPTPLQPRHAKTIADEDSLMAVISPGLWASVI